MARPRIRKIHVADVELVAFTLARKFLLWDEPIPPFQTRFPNRLESCLETPFQTFGRKSLYRGLTGKAAILFYLLNKNHPFQNGNKRIAVTTLLYFLYENGQWLSVSNESLYQFAKEVAGGDSKHMENAIQKIEEYIKSHMVPL
jgi:death-on-curing family protein